MKDLLKESTKRILREYSWKNILNLRYLFMYLYIRWPERYLKIARSLLPRVSEGNKKKQAGTYHGKVLTSELAKKIVSVNKEIPLQDLEKIIPYPAARKIILHNPLDIVALECPCRAGAPNPCKPSMVCLIIGQPFAGFVLEHHAGKSKKLTQQEALELLEEAHKKGWVHTAYFKEACLDRFYAICNCCKCCCLGLQAMVTYGIPMLSPSGFSAEIDENLCLKCQACVGACPFQAITADCRVDREKCMGCGACMSACARKAITLARDESKGIPLDIEAL